MDLWWMCEVPYPNVPKAVLDEADSVRASLPNRWCDPRVAANLFEEVIDEYLLCDDVGLNIAATEHHAGINSLIGSNPMLVSILARQTRKVRILSLGTLISLRREPVRIAEEYATADVISRGRLELGFVKSGGSEMASANANPVNNIERYWESIAWLPQKIGRKRVGEIQGYVGAAGLVVAGLCYPLSIGGFPVFILALIATVIVIEGGAANLAPYVVEVYGVRLGARAAGLSQAANGVGKILGPLCLALIAGADNPLSPQATADAVLPAFVFLGACSLAIGLAVTFLGPETHGRPIGQSFDERDVPSGALKPAEGHS